MKDRVYKEKEKNDCVRKLNPETETKKEKKERGSVCVCVCVCVCLCEREREGGGGLDNVKSNEELFPIRYQKLPTLLTLSIEKLPLKYLKLSKPVKNCYIYLHI
jgi:hypothetical protein